MSMNSERRILIEVGHPAHVHQFKHMFWELEKSGWKGLFVTKDKECALDLLKEYKLPYVLLGKTQNGTIRKLLSLPFFCYRMLRIALKFKPDMFISRVSPLSGYASFLLRKPHIAFTDTENVKLLDSISEPFADVVLTSTAYYRDHGKKQIRYPGYHELAYLHHRRFVPQPVWEMLNIPENEPYAVVRFVSWNAHHDIGHKGISERNKIELVEQLASRLKVFVSAEGDLPKDIQRFRISVHPVMIHDVLYHAKLFVGESATMASESTMLGTPAAYVNSQHFGCTDEQAGYGLLSLFPETEEGQQNAIKKAIKLAETAISNTSVSDAFDKMIREKIDVTKFMVWFVDNYPESRIRTATAKPSFFEEFK